MTIYGTETRHGTRANPYEKTLAKPALWRPLERSGWPQKANVHPKGLKLTGDLRRGKGRPFGVRPATNLSLEEIWSRSAIEIPISAAHQAGLKITHLNSSCVSFLASRLPITPSQIFQRRRHILIIIVVVDLNLRLRNDPFHNR